MEATPDAPRFVVQRHRARTLHFDLRLEIDGVLASWAVPKGPSMDPGTKRLAVRVDDHDLEYLGHEGAVGSGSAIVWDIGTYRHTTRRDGQPVTAEEALADGHLTIAVRGHKLAGGFALTQTSLGGDRANWLLVKMADEWADRSAPEPDDVSVLSGRRHAELEGDGQLFGDEEPSGND